MATKTFITFSHLSYWAFAFFNPYLRSGFIGFCITFVVLLLLRSGSCGNNVKKRALIEKYNIFEQICHRLPIKIKNGMRSRNSNMSNLKRNKFIIAEELVMRVAQVDKYLENATCEVKVWL